MFLAYDGRLRGFPRPFRGLSVTPVVDALNDKPWPPDQSLSVVVERRHFSPFVRTRTMYYALGLGVRLPPGVLGLETG
jgi:hypothetical protein